MLEEWRSVLSRLLDPVMGFLDGVEEVAERGLDQLHVEYGAQLAITRSAWGLVVVLLVGITRGYLRLVVLVGVGLVLAKLYGWL